MQRRTFLASSAAVVAASALAPRPVLAQASPRVAVIGAGIMGASIAYHLAERGARVVVLEKASPGSVCTQGAFAMLIASHEEGPASFNSLYGAAILDWRRLDMEMGGAVHVQWGGTLSWAAPGEAAQKLAADFRKSRSWGSAIEPVTAQDMARLAPGVTFGPVGAGVFSPNQGTVDPSEACNALVEAGRRRGVDYRYPCEVRAIVMDGGKVTGLETSQGRVDADIVVVAAGHETDRLARMVGAKAPHTLVSGTLAHTAPHERVLNRVLNGPAGSIKQNPDGRFVTGLDYRPGADGTDVSEAYGRQLLATAARTVPAIGGAKLEKMTVGYVPIPQDSQPIVGFCNAPSNLYLALSMSGITMAPLMGRLAAAEIVDGLNVEMLSPYRPARFA